LRRIYAEAAWLQQLASEELKPRPGRIRTSIRMAFIAAVGAALMAALHVGPGLGPVILWVALYGSSSAFTVSAGLMLIAAYAVMLIASIFLAGVLVDFPWMLLPFLAAATALISYAFKKQGFVGAWFYMVIAFLDTFYLCVFDPQNFGWSVAYTFSGVAVGIAVLVAFDTVLWPDPAEPKLLHSLADTLDRQRQRLTAIARAYFNAGAATEWPQPAVSILPVHLPLLERARRETKNPEREAILLAAVTITERLHIEIERLLAIARDNVSRDIRARLRPEIGAVLQAIAAALQQYAREAATGLKAVDDHAHQQCFTKISASLDALQAREDLILNALRSVDATAVSNIAAFTQSLRRIGERLLNHPIGYVYGLAFSKETKPKTTEYGGVDRPLMRHCAKLGLAATLGYVVGVVSYRSELSVIVWTAVMGGLPTYGATLRKMILRVVGAVIGGLLALAIIIVVSPNFPSVGAYLLAFFVVLFICAYVSLSSGRLAYAGQQAGVAFVVGYAALSPSANFYEPLWRVWGIFLGLLILTLVFLLIAPEYAAKAIAPRLAGLLRSALQLVRPAAGISTERVQEIDMEATLHVRELLAIAEDARMEGRHSSVNPDRVIDAAGTLRRIVHRLSGMVTARLLHPQPELPPEFREARAECVSALHQSLQAWLDVLQDEHPDRRRVAEVAARFTPDRLTLPLGKLHEHLSTSGLRELASWPAAARSAFLAEIESYRRLVVLMTEFNHQFAEIPSATR
jgi:uncharacterized membrane protein YgaE (UPF0421/DUF939 family)